MEAPTLGVWSTNDHYLDGERMQMSGPFVKGTLALRADRWRQLLAGLTHSRASYYNNYTADDAGGVVSKTFTLKQYKESADRVAGSEIRA